MICRVVLEISSMSCLRLSMTSLGWCMLSKETNPGVWGGRGQKYWLLLGVAVHQYLYGIDVAGSSSSVV